MSDLDSEDLENQGPNLGVSKNNYGVVFGEGGGLVLL